MKRKIFNIIQIRDKSNHLSRAFDIFITATIILNIILTFLQTFEELSFLSLCFNILEDKAQTIPPVFRKVSTLQAHNLFIFNLDVSYCSCFML